MTPNHPPPFDRALQEIQRTLSLQETKKLLTDEEFELLQKSAFKLDLEDLDGHGKYRVNKTEALRMFEEWWNPEIKKQRKLEEERVKKQRKLEVEKEYKKARQELWMKYLKRAKEVFKITSRAPETKRAPETNPLIPEWANQTENPTFYQKLDISTALRRRGDQWYIGITAEFMKTLGKIDKNLRARILEALAQIATAPVTPVGNTINPLLKNKKGMWRYRIGDYRLIYQPDENTKHILLLTFTARGNAYE